jgi:hypothetical protein
MVSGSERLGPLSDYTANCRPVLSSERRPIDTIPQISDSNIPTGNNIWSQDPSTLVVQVTCKKGVFVVKKATKINLLVMYL